MAVLQPSLPKGLHFEQGCGAVFHDTADAGKAVVGVLDDMSERDCLRHELFGGFAGWLEHHQGAAGGRLGGQGEGCARQAIEEEHRHIGERRPDPLSHVDRDRFEKREPLATARARPGEPVPGLAIPPTSNFLNDDGSISGGSAGRPNRDGPPTVPCPRERARRPGRRSCERPGRYPIRARPEWTSTLPQVPPAQQRTGASGSGADDHIEGYQSCPEDPGPSGGGHRAALRSVGNAGRGWG